MEIEPEVRPRWFRVLGGMTHETNGRALAKLGSPMFVPWEMLAPHEAQAVRNHSQSLEKLNSRGGLCPSEMVAVLEDRDWRDMTLADAVAKLKAHLVAWKLETGNLEIVNDPPGLNVH